MGVQGLWELLSPIGRPVSLESLQNKTLAIDINVSIWLNQALKGYKDKQGHSPVDAHLLIVFNRICKLLFYKIKPIFVFDGRTPQLKKQTLLARQEQREVAAQKSKKASHYILKKYILEKLKNPGSQKVTEQTEKEVPIVDQDNTKTNVDLCDDIVESDSESEINSFNYGMMENFQDLSSVNFETEEFKSLPLDIQHELLTNIKDAYKRRFWVQKQDMPEKSCDFSDYQMMQLLHRRKIQKKLEDIQTAMSNRSSSFIQEMQVSLINLEAGMAEERRVISDDTACFVLFKNSSKGISDNILEEKQQSGNVTEENIVEKEGSNIDDKGNLLTKIGNLEETVVSDSRNPDSQSNIGSKQGTLLPDIKEDLYEIPRQTQLHSQIDDRILQPTETVISDHELTSVHVEFNEMSSDKTDKLPSNDHILSSLVVTETSTTSEKQRTTGKALHCCEVNESYLPEKNEISDIHVSPIHKGPEIESAMEQDNGSHIFDAASVNRVECKAGNTKNNSAEKQPITKEKEPIIVVIDPTEEPIIDDELFPATVFRKLSDEPDEEPVDFSEWKVTDEAIQELEMSVRALESKKQTQDKRALTITEHMYEETQELLTLFGIPYVNSPTEAEAQCAQLDILKLTDGTITDDSDVWLFGGKQVYKNFFAKKKYVEFFKDTDIQSEFNLNRTKLIALAMLCGSDYTQGIQGVGPITAMEILSEFPGNGIESLQKFKKWWKDFRSNKELPKNNTVMKLQKLELEEGFPSEIVYNAYINPVVDDSTEKFTWGRPDLDRLREKEKFGWTLKKVDDILLPVMKQVNDNQIQMKIDGYFTVDLKKEEKLFPSKRLQKAVKKMHSRSADSTITETDNKTKRLDKRKTSKRKQKRTQNKRSHSSSKSCVSQTELDLSEDSLSDS